jgi:hypothetical protein
LNFDLSEEVARWLHDLMQNPIYEDESCEEAGMRQEILHALTNIDDRKVRNSPFYNPEDNIPF